MKKLFILFLFVSVVLISNFITFQMFIKQIIDDTTVVGQSIVDLDIAETDIFNSDAVDPYVVKLIINDDNSARWYNIFVFPFDFGEASTVYTVDLHPRFNTTLLFNPEYNEVDQYLQQIEKTRRANANIRDVFENHLKEFFNPPPPLSPRIHLATNRFISVEHQIAARGSGARMGISFFITVDMKTGEIVYLDDLFEINDEFIDRLLSENVAKSPYVFHHPDEEISALISFIQPSSDWQRSMFSRELLIDRILYCTQEYKAHTSGYQYPMFFLTEGKGWFHDVHTLFPMDDFNIFYVNLEDLYEFLKVEPW